MYKYKLFRILKGIKNIKPVSMCVVKKYKKKGIQLVMLQLIS